MLLTKLSNPLEQCSLKFASDNSGEFEGYGSVFNSIDKGGDTIAPGAYTKALKKGLPKMFINHLVGIPVGDYLEAKEDDHGLYMRGLVDLNHRDGPTLHSAMKRGAMGGLSIGALRASLVTEKMANGNRLIKEVGDLIEVSVVTFPMEERAAILSVKSDIEIIENLKEAESFLRDSGFSKSAATAFVSRVRDMGRRDADTELQSEITKLQAIHQSKQVTASLLDVIHRL